MKKYRVIYKLFKKNGIVGMRSVIKEAESIIDMMCELQDDILTNEFIDHIEIYKICYIPEGVKTDEV